MAASTVDENALSATLFHARWTSYLFFAVLSFVLWCLKDAFLTPLRKIPGPTVAKYSDLWGMLEVGKGRCHLWYRELHDKYGPVVRIGPNRVIFSDTGMLATVYGPGSQYVKSKLYFAFQVEIAAAPLPGLPNPSRASIFSTRDPHYHKHIKSAVSHAYAMSSLKQLEPLVDKCSDIFVARMHEFAEAGEVVDLGQWFQFYAFDVVGMITFMKRFGYLEAGQDTSGLIDDLHTGIAYGGTVGMMPWLHNFLLGCLPLQQQLMKLKSMREMNPALKIRKLVYACVNEYDPAAKEARGDYLEYLRKSQLKEENGVTNREVVDSLFVNIFAGSDTTGITLRSIFYYLMKHPAVYKKLLAEIDEADAAGRLSANVEFAQGNELPYLKAVVKEAMRIFPGVPMHLERIVPTGGLQLGSYYLPPGTLIGAAPSVINFDRAAFGGDADDFRPERWLDASPERLRTMEKAFLSFGMGSRFCIGKNIVTFEMYKIVPQFLRFFDLEWAGDADEWKISGYWFAKQDGVKVKLKARKRA